MEPIGLQRGTTTGKWISMEGVRKRFEEWAKANASLDIGDPATSKCSTYFNKGKPKPLPKPLPGNNNLSAWLVAVLRKERKGIVIPGKWGTTLKEDKEGVLIPGRLVTIYLPKYPRNFHFYSSILNPDFSFNDFLRTWEKATPIRTAPGEVWRPEGVTT
jgi:hypothetical protein